MNKIDFGKPVRTKAGTPVRIICTDREGDYPVIGLINVPGTYHRIEEIRTWTADGKAFVGSANHGGDLENMPTEFSRWLNVYRRPIDEKWFNGTFFETRLDAEKEGKASAYYVDTVEVKWKT